MVAATIIIKKINSSYILRQLPNPLPLQPMLRLLLAIFLIIALISASFSRFFVYASFHFNRTYITKELCENKNRPLMNCQGKCYLMKKLKQAEENEKKQTDKNNLNNLEVSFVHQPLHLTFIAPILLRSRTTCFPGYDFLYSSRYIDTIFRPPKLIA